MKTHVVELSLCPNCGHPLNRATTVSGDDKAPEPGDMTVCVSCAIILTFQAYGMTKATDAELSNLDPKDRLILEQLQRIVLSNPMPPRKQDS